MGKGKFDEYVVFGTVWIYILILMGEEGGALRSNSQGTMYIASMKELSFWVLVIYLPTDSLLCEDCIIAMYIVCTVL